MYWHDLPSDIKTEILILSIDLRSITAVSLSLMCLKPVTREWRKILRSRTAWQVIYAAVGLILPRSWKYGDAIFKMRAIDESVCLYWMKYRMNQTCDTYRIMNNSGESVVCIIEKDIGIAAYDYDDYLVEHTNDRITLYYKDISCRRTFVISTPITDEHDLRYFEITDTGIDILFIDGARDTLKRPDRGFSLDFTRGSICETKINQKRHELLFGRYSYLKSFQWHIDVYANASEVVGFNRILHRIIWSKSCQNVKYFVNFLLCTSTERNRIEIIDPVTGLGIKSVYKQILGMTIKDDDSGYIIWYDADAL